MMECNFTLKHYERVLTDAKKAGYRFYKLKDYQKIKDKKMIIFLRHDIDFNLKLALNFAKIENKLGIHATYFVRVHAGYNLFSLKNYNVINLLMKMGHEIGFHYERDFPVLNNETSKQMIKRDKAVLEAVTNIKIKGCSAHEPARKGHLITDENLSEFGFSYHAYSEEFLKKNKYISDSSSRWREGCMCGFVKKKTPRLYILTHPIWWYNKSPLENY